MTVTRIKIVEGADMNPRYSEGDEIDLGMFKATVTKVVKDMYVPIYEAAFYVKADNTLISVGTIIEANENHCLYFDPSGAIDQSGKPTGEEPRPVPAKLRN